MYTQAMESRRWVQSNRCVYICSGRRLRPRCTAAWQPACVCDVAAHPAALAVRSQPHSQPLGGLDNEFMLSSFAASFAVVLAVRLASPRLVSPRLALPRARTPLRSRSQSARSTFFLHVLFPRLYPVSRVKPIGVGPREFYKPCSTAEGSVRQRARQHEVRRRRIMLRFVSFLRPVPVFCNF